MICLSGFEPHPCWVPLRKDLIDVRIDLKLLKAPFFWAFHVKL